MEEEIDVGEPMYAYPSYPMEEDDGPLDMSMKKRRSSQEFSNHSKAASPPSYFDHTLGPQNTISPSETRPSVITCAARQVVPHSPSNFEEPSYPPPPYNVATLIQDRHQYQPTVKTYATPLINHLKTEDVKTEDIDPEIEEHFRRSLGYNYQQEIDKKKSAKLKEEPNDSVDDHFEKALGDEWIKWKAKNKCEEPSHRYDAPPPYQNQPWKHKYVPIKTEASPPPPPSYVPPKSLINHDNPLSTSPKNYRQGYCYSMAASEDGNHNPNVPLSLSPKVSRTS